MAWKKDYGVDFGNVRTSLIIDSFEISKFAANAWLMEDGVQAWGARIRGFDSRCYPIIENFPSLKQERAKIIRFVQSQNPNDKDKLFKAYNIWFKFLNKLLVRIDAYPEIPYSHIGKKPPYVPGKPLV